MARNGARCKSINNNSNNSRKEIRRLAGKRKDHCNKQQRKGSREVRILSWPNFMFLKATDAVCLEGVNFDYDVTKVKEIILILQN